ncbi:MAG TPA: hypothetical protein VMM55_02105, partial [Thermohalobaculum sp.]|nr:hypothetical protein [Thermohalobaculum sp.]
MRRAASRRVATTRLATALGLAAALVVAAPASAQSLLVPMDEAQENHLRAYGLAYWAIEQGESAEWLLNYRDGAFLLPNQRRVVEQAALRGVTVRPLSGA